MSIRRKVARPSNPGGPGPAVDLFIEHGSTPAGTIPNLDMPAWGDTGALTPQQIADVIAYVISLNQ